MACRLIVPAFGVLRMADEAKTARRRRLVRGLSFPVCTLGGTLLGAFVGEMLRGGGDSIFPPRLAWALVGLVIGLVAAAVIATSIDVANRRR
jgi:hypothetical protein